MKRIKSSLLMLLGICLLLSGGWMQTARAASSEHGLELHVINVGKADCLLIKCDGLFMLVDTGLVDSEPVIRDYLTAQGVARLEYLVATHPDKDHIGGMPWVIATYDIGQAWICPLPEDSKPYMRMMAAAGMLDVVYPERGHTAALGGASITVLSPTEELLETDDENECSIVLMLEYGGRRILLTGDAQGKAESSLLKSGYELSADVLKVGHHGSDQSCSNAFLDAVSPEVAVISCGYSDDDFYPANSTLNKLFAHGAAVYRTDADGTIIVYTDGESLGVTALGTDVAAAGYVLDTKKLIYHLITCTELPKKKRSQYCATLGAAQAAGGTPCEVCLGGESGQ